MPARNWSSNIRRRIPYYFRWESRIKTAANLPEVCMVGSSDWFERVLCAHATVRSREKWRTTT